MSHKLSYTARSFIGNHIHEAICIRKGKKKKPKIGSVTTGIMEVMKNEKSEISLFELLVEFVINVKLCGLWFRNGIFRFEI